MKRQKPFLLYFLWIIFLSYPRISYADNAVTVQLDNKSFTSSLALWYPGVSELQICLFEKPLTVKEREKYQYFARKFRDSSKGVGHYHPGSPPIVIILTLLKDTVVPKVSSIKQYLLLIKHDGRLWNFSSDLILRNGSIKEFEAFTKPPRFVPTRIQSFGGKLEPGGEISIHLQGSKSFGKGVATPKDINFALDLEILTHIVVPQIGQ